MLLTITSCAELQGILSAGSGESGSKANTPLTKIEIQNGLKEALRVCTDSAVSMLSATNGYYGDDLVKILLPKEANMIVNNLSKIPGGDKLVENVVVSINRAAEDAAKEAAPIFLNAIKEMTIMDAANILAGADTAATSYFKQHTYKQLFDLYSPKLKASTNKQLVKGLSADIAWETLTSKYNMAAKSILGEMAGLKPVELDLNEYLTKKALDGMFLKIAEKEKNIRKNPVEQVTDLLKRVFGGK